MNDLSDYKLEKYFAKDIVLPVLSSRGCYWRKCSFCDHDFGMCYNIKNLDKLIDEIKPELQKKGVVFVYITGESSPLEKWQGMIANIEGEHYRLTNQQWGKLCGSLGLLGIPSYMILNKDGSTAYDNFKTGGYPGSEVLQNQAEVALTK